MYKIKVSAKDKNGNDIVQEITFEVTDQDERELGATTSLAMSTNKATYEPGETVELQLTTSIKDAHIFLSSLRRDKSRNYKWYNFTGKEKEQLSVSESDRGNIAVNGFTVYNNRFYSTVKQI